METKFPGGAAALRKLPVIRTRPDVTVRTQCRDSECKVDGGVRFEHVGPPSDGIESLVKRLQEGGHDKVMAGYRHGRVTSGPVPTFFSFLILHPRVKLLLKAAYTRGIIYWRVHVFVCVRRGAGGVVVGYFYSGGLARDQSYTTG